MIQFTESHEHHSLPQRTLHDELDQSTDYRAFKLEEIGAIKVELDQSRYELHNVTARNVDLEDQTRRLKNELKTIGNIQQSVNPHVGRIKLSVRNAHTNTDEIKPELATFQ